MEFAKGAFLRLVSALEYGREGVFYALAAVGGFFCAASSMLSSLSPFGLAFAGAVAPQYSLWATAGAVPGYLLMTDESMSLRYLASLVLLLGLRWSFGFVSEERIVFYTPLMAGVSVGVTGMAVALSGTGLMSTPTVLCESAITATAGILFSKAMRSYEGALPTTGTGGVCFAVLLCVLLTGGAEISGGAFPFVYTAVLWLSLASAAFSKSGQAVVIAAAASSAAALSGREGLFAPLVVFALSATVFSPLGRFGEAAAAAGAGVIALLFSDNISTVAEFSASCLMAGGVFLITPLSAVRALGLVPKASDDGGAASKSLAALRLSVSKEALVGAAKMTGDAVALLETLRTKSASAFIEDACQAVCRGCTNRTRCWQHSYTDTLAAAENVFYSRSRSWPEHLGCKREGALLSSLTAAHTQFLSCRAAREQTRGLKAVTVEQFAGMGELLGAVGDSVDELAKAPEEVHSAAFDTLSALLQAPLSCACYTSRDGRIRVLAEVAPMKAARLTTAAAEALSEAVCQTLLPSKTISVGDKSVLWWEAAPPYFAETCMRQRSAGDEPFCGDSAGSFQISSGEVMLLCDGMGVGKGAALDSTMTVSILERLLKAEIPFSAALPLVSSALLSRGEERLCTVDAAFIDLFSLTLTCHKAGAAPTFVCRDRRVHKIERSSLPAGILGGIRPEKTVFSLREGDIIVMVSDGLTDTGSDWLPSQILSLAEESLDTLCDGLLQTAAERAVGGRRDDCTVLAAKITVRT